MIKLDIKSNNHRICKYLRLKKAKLNKNPHLKRDKEFLITNYPLPSLQTVVPINSFVEISAEGRVECFHSPILSAQRLV